VNACGYSDKGRRRLRRKIWKIIPLYPCLQAPTSRLANIFVRRLHFYPNEWTPVPVQSWHCPCLGVHLDAPTGGIIFTSGRAQRGSPSSFARRGTPMAWAFLSRNVKLFFLSCRQREFRSVFTMLERRRELQLAIQNGRRERVARGKKLHVPNLIRFDGHAFGFEQITRQCVLFSPQPLFRFVACPRGVTVAPLLYSICVVVTCTFIVICSRRNFLWRIKIVWLIKMSECLNHAITIFERYFFSIIDCHHMLNASRNLRHKVAKFLYCKNLYTFLF